MQISQVGEQQMCCVPLPLLKHTFTVARPTTEGPQWVAQGDIRRSVQRLMGQGVLGSSVSVWVRLWALMIVKSHREPRSCWIVHRAQFLEPCKPTVSGAYVLCQIKMMIKLNWGKRGQALQLGFVRRIENGVRSIFFWHWQSWEQTWKNVGVHAAGRGCATWGVR